MRLFKFLSVTLSLLLWGGARLVSVADTGTDVQVHPITIYVAASDTASNHIYLWNGWCEHSPYYKYIKKSGDDTKWPATYLDQFPRTVINNKTYYYFTLPDTVKTINVQFNKGNEAKTEDITGITRDAYFTYDGGTTYDTATISKEITVYVKKSSSNGDCYLYAWTGGYEGTTDTDVKLTGDWPGKKLSELISQTINGEEYYTMTFGDGNSTKLKYINVILNSGSGANQTGNLTNITRNVSFTYESGGTSVGRTKLDSVFYLVSEDFTGSNKIEYCKFTPDRLRNGGALNYEYQSLHLQDFVLPSDGLSFWIEDSLGNKFTTAFSDKNNTLEDTTQTYSNAYFEGPITGDDKFGASSTVNYYWLRLQSPTCSTPNKFTIKKGAAASYTFLYDRMSSDSDQPMGGLRLLANGNYFGGETVDTEGYYLIGNFTSASSNVNIDPQSSTDNRTLLTPYYYKNGNQYGGTAADADSIVYKTEVAKPANGWGQLYMDVVSASDYNKYSSSSWSGSTDAWKTVIRPEAAWLYQNSDGTHGLDGTALRGGLFKNDNVAYQSLNPVVSDTISSYIFSMNATTSTYTIEFVSHTEKQEDVLYLFGEAVSTEVTNGTSNNWSDAKGVPLTLHSDGYYYYAGTEDGSTTEAPVTMKAGKAFDFVWNMDFSDGYYGEDGATPAILIDNSGKSTESSAYSATASNSNYDTQYVNILADHATASAAAHSTDIRDITWNLPTGEYYIRFYIGTQNGEQRSNLYTVRRSYKLLRPNTEGITVGGKTFNTFKVFCDYNAVVVPDTVTAIYVSPISSALTKNKSDNSSSYTTYTLTLDTIAWAKSSAKEDTLHVLPANTPVILAMNKTRTESSTELEDTELQMYYHSDPASTLNATTTAMTSSITYEAAPSAQEDDVYNFVFGYKKLSDSDTKPTIGFFYPKTGKIAINGAYLSVNSSYLNSAGEAKEAALVFYSDLVDADESDGNETTGIDNALETEADTDASYYTLQGTRIAKPTAKGVYIYKGKKIIVK